MTIILASSLLFLLSSFLNLSIFPKYRKVNFINSAISFFASLIGFVGALFEIFSGGKFFPINNDFFLDYFRLDYISCFFLLALYLIVAAVSIYGNDYLKKIEEKKQLSFFWMNFHILVFSMSGVLLSKNAFLFLFFWELMAFSSFFLVMTEHRKKEVQKAGLIYLCANGAGAIFLIAAFSLTSDSYFNFAPTMSGSNWAFFFFLLGFGLKAGFIPLHIWLPEAHPAAPGNVSALMSAIMIKMGIYGIFRTLSLLPLWQQSWGWTILVIGIISSILGVIFALAQHNIKKLLAYSSVENIGIIMIAIGLGILLNLKGFIELSILSFCAAFLHTLNHAIFKSLLFMSAGSVMQASSSGEIDELGGLYRRMPQTAFFFLIASAAVSGLPFLNGFVSEFIIYYCSFKSISSGNLFSVFSVLALSVTGALAIACFTKAFSVIFLGLPRKINLDSVVETGRYMRAGMAILAFFSIGIGILPYFSFKFLFFKFNPILTESLVWSEISRIFIFLSGIYLCAIFFFAVFIFMRRRIISENRVAFSSTWDCGYLASSPRIQYTGSSFANPLIEFFSIINPASASYPSIKGYFPSESSYSSHPRAFFYETLYKPAIDRLRKTASFFSFIHGGNLRMYVLYIFLSLLALILWKI